MNPEERLAALEREAARLQSVLREIGTLIQEQGGEQNMMFAAALALVETAPHPQILGPVLRRELESVESKALFQAGHEGQLEGAQAARASLLHALDKAEATPGVP